MTIRELTEYSEEAYVQIAALMAQLSDRCVLGRDVLRAVVEDDHSHLYVCVDDRIVACATLCVFVSPTGCKASVEDVVVSEECRGRHIGRELMNHVIGRARELAPVEVHLTSRPGRVAANALYASVGFERRETNVYRLILE